MTTRPLADAYRDAIRVALVLHVVLTVLLLSILDGGTLAKAGGAAMVGFWVGVAIVMTRRPRSPGEIDLLDVRWGVVATRAIAIALTPWMGVLRLRR